MTYKKPLFFSLAAIAMIFVAAQWPANDPGHKEAMVLRAMMAGLTQLHYEPVQIDDKFSSNVYDLYLERLNGGKRFLTYSDYNQLNQYQYEIDNQIASGQLDFFDLSYDLITVALQKTKGYYKEILSEPFDFDKVEYIELDSDKRKLAENDNELKAFWRSQLKYETMVRVADRLKAKEEGKEEWKDKTYEEIEKASRESIIERYDTWYNGLEKLDRMDRFSGFLNAITATYDPHTSYLEPIDKQTFDMNMQGKLEGIGATLTLQGDYTKVASIVAGGPAWAAGELEVDDLILKVTQGDEGEAENVVGFNLDEVVSRIRGKKGTLVKLMIRKPDNSEKEINITRDEVKLDQTWAKSLKLDLPDTEEIGYVHLPRFYGDFAKDGRTCSGDIEQEVAKLVKEGAKGIVLDLRNNGGGYLQEVINMTGQFIEDGPVVQEKYREKDPIVRKDRDPKVQYDGPLVVLVNEFSASASEIISAALQDYGRAVIIGSKSTYGKGTVQQFIDLDRAIQGNADVKPLGHLRVTIRKYYRIDGGSVQLKGVEPDIVLPDAYAFIDTGEKDQDYPLAWTEIEPADFKATVGAVQGIEKIIAASEARIRQDETFGLITQNAYRIKDLRDQTKYPLNLKEYQLEEKKRAEDAKRFDDLDDVKIEGLKVSNLKADMDRINANDKSIDVNKKFMESMESDIYVAEAMRVVSDIIKNSDRSTAMKKVKRP